MNSQPYSNPINSVNAIENLFKLYKDDKTESFYYNICNSVFFPKDMDISTWQKWQVPGSGISWMYISYLIYSTTDLWWLLCILNNIDNPLTPPAGGTIIKILSPNTLRNILSQIQYAKD